MASSTSGGRYLIGVAIGMEYVEGKMHIATSWTTAVCLLDNTVVSTASVLTSTPDVLDGVKQVLRDVLKGINPADVKQINIATPQALNAVIQEENLSKVTVVRLCGSASQSLLPFENIPDNTVKSKIMGDIKLLNGGYEFNHDKGTNRPIAPVDVQEVRQCIVDISKSQFDNVVICGIYSPDKADQEIQVGQLFSKYQPKLNVTLSHQVIKNAGLYERENASILNASLKTWFNENVKKIDEALAAVDLHTPFYLVQNDNTLISGKSLGPASSQFPVNTFFPLEACTMKPNNLTCTGSKDVIVVNIGGTRSTAGFVKGANFEVSIMDVSGIKAFRKSPHVVISNLGMFSKVHQSEQTVTIGPDSVDDPNQTLVFGGNILTCLDIAVAAKRISMGDPDKVKDLDKGLIDDVLKHFGDIIAELIDEAKESSHDVTAVFHGFGSALIPENMPGISKVMKPEYYEFAEAIGAAVMDTKEAGITERPETEEPKPGVVSAIWQIAGVIGRMTFSVLERAAPWNVFKVQDTGSNQMYPRALQYGPLSRKERKLRLRHKASKTTGRRYHHDQCKTEIEVSDKPDINPEGEWLLSKNDLELLSIGVGVLGSGGGGSPELGLLMALQQLKKGKKIRVKVPQRLQAHEMTTITAMMGSPPVVLEKYPNGSEGTNSLKCIQDLYKCGYKVDGDNWSIAWKPAGTVLKDNDEAKLTYDQDFPIVYSDCPPQVDNIGALIPVESGGINTLQALIVASEAGLPVLDCDGEGRAVPKLQMIGPSMYGSSLFPASISDDKGRRSVALNGPSARSLEQFFREQVVNMGGYAAVSFGPMTKSTVEQFTVKYTISKAWRIGERIIRARREEKDPIESIVEYENGKLLIKDGKVTYIHPENAGGFNPGKYTIADGNGAQVMVEFQNENLVVWDPKNKPLASIPDIISVVDSEGNPLTTELLHIGRRVSVIALPCSPLLTTPQALKFVGPRVLGYDFDYTPVGKYHEAEPIPPLP